MRERSVTAVIEDVVVIAAGVLKCIGQNRHRAKVTRFVHLTRESNGGVGAPGGRERHWGVRIRPVDVADEGAPFHFGLLKNDGKSGVLFGEVVVTNSWRDEFRIHRSKNSKRIRSGTHSSRLHLVSVCN